MGQPPDIGAVNVDAVIFDMDGLMLDTERIAKQAWQRAASEFGFELRDALYQQIVGRAVQDIEQRIYQAFGSEARFYEIRGRKQQYFEDYITAHGVPLKPGLLDLLDFLEAQGIAKAVASSTYKRDVIRRLRFAGVLERFEHIIAGDAVERGKPAPDIFLMAAEQLAVPPAQCVVLEDSDAGIRAAHAAQMIPILVPDLKPPADGVAALAYRVLPSLGAVQDFLVAHLKAA